VIKLNKFTPEQIKSFHQRMQLSLRSTVSERPAGAGRSFLLPERPLQGIGNHQPTGSVIL
jgi:hypothetical protein